MKNSVIILNIISILVLICFWLNLYLRAIWSSFSTSNSPNYFLDSWMLVLKITFIITFISIILSYSKIKNFYIWWEKIPYIAFLIWAIYIYYYTDYYYTIEYKKYINTYEIQKNNTKKIIEKISKDYINEEESNNKNEELFITIDPVNNLLIQIIVKYSTSFETRIIWKISEWQLIVFEKDLLNELYYNNFFDKNWKTIYDNYKLIYSGDQYHGKYVWNFYWEK